MGRLLCRQRFRIDVYPLNQSESAQSRKNLKPRRLTADEWCGMLPLSGPSSANDSPNRSLTTEALAPLKATRRERVGREAAAENQPGKAVSREQNQ
jgi:hypothetical protein